MENSVNISINYTSSKDAEEKRLMHSKRPYNDANVVFDKLFESLCSMYQGNLEKSKKRSEFLF